MATKYFMNGGVNSYWATDGNWSTTSSAGPANTTKAVNGDTAVFDAGSPNCTLNAAAACSNLNMTGYAATLALGSNPITISSYTVTLGGTITGNGSWTANGVFIMTANGGTLTTNGVSIPGLYINSTGIDLVGNLVITSGLFITNIAVAVTVAYDITCYNFYLYFPGGFTWAAGRTLTVTNAFAMPCGTLGFGGGNAIKSGTASSYAYLVYTGTAAGCNLVAASFTDISYSGTIVKTLPNWQGGTLTRCVGIANVGPADLFGPALTSVMTGGF